MATIIGTCLICSKSFTDPEALQGHSLMTGHGVKRCVPWPDTGRVQRPRRGMRLTGTSGLKRLVLVLALSGTLALGVLPAWAGCSYYDYSYNGRSVHCTVCCVGSYCHTTCS